MPRNHPQEPRPARDYPNREPEYLDALEADEPYALTGSPVPRSAPSPRQLIRWAAVAVVVLIGGWFAWHQYTAHQEASKIEKLTSMVEQSMQDKFDSDQRFSNYRIRVEKVSLIKESGNKYDGIATVRTVSGEHDVAIQVTADGNNMMWQAEPGALLFLVKDNLQSLTAPSPWSQVSTAAMPTSAPNASAGLPTGAQPCPATAGQSGSFTHSAIGTSVTSCPFAEQVRLAYGASGPPSATPRQISAVSPLTGESYTMTCAANGSLATCTGGDDAIVYVY